MNASQVVLLVVAILAVQVVIWVPLARWLSRRLAACDARLRAMLDAAGETAQCGPERVRFVRAVGIAAVGTTGAAALTARRLLFVGFSGEPVEILRDDIADVRAARWFQGSAQGGRMHVILTRRSGESVSLMVRDHAAWMSALATRAPAPAQGP